MGQTVNFIETVIDHLGNGNLDTAFDELAKRRYYDEKTDTFGSFGVAKIIKFLGGPERAKNLLETVRTVVKFGKKHGYNIDLHSGNYMQRSDGTTVVNDPFVLWLRA